MTTNGTSPAHYQKLAAHVGHEIECVAYGRRDNVAIECVDCGEVLTDADQSAHADFMPSGRCKTCGSEIVETINRSHFHESECGPCEYERYKTQAALLEAAKEALTILSEIQCDLEDDKGEAHCITLLEDSIKAYGNAA